MVLLWGGVLPCLATAQIRTIPQTVRDSVNRPTTLANSPMHLADGEVDFGTLNEEDAPWQGAVRWRNAGDKPLVVTRITSSCGCLRATFDRQPVAAGGESVLRLTYHPKGHPGTVYQRLFVYTHLSASRPTAIVTVRGVVTPSKEVAATYSQSMGVLHLRTKEVRASGDEREWRIACYNNGRQPLQIAADTLLTPRGWRLMSEPSPLPPQTAGDLVIRRTDEPSAKESQEVVLYVGGLTLPPRMRALRVLLETK